MTKLFIPLMALTIVTTSSCIKSYTCACTANGATYNNTIAPTTKGKAQESCDTYKGYLTEKQGVSGLECKLE